MKSISSIGRNPKVQALCIGKFDGMHQGHQAIFSTLSNQIRSKEEGSVLVVCKNRTNPSLTPFQEECFPLPMIYLELSEISSMSGEEFLLFLKDKYPNLFVVVVGEDFRFGKNRSCGIEELQKHFKTIIVPEVKLDGEGIHTQAILSYLAEGNLIKVNAMLGRIYCIRGEICKGQGLGREKLYPTLNLLAPLYILPQSGVYITCSKLKGKFYKSVTFLGHRLSTDGKFCIESYLLEFDDEIRSGEMEIFFFEKMRDNQHFNSLEELKIQIAKDIALAKEYHSAQETITLVTSKLL
ncbi:bifunctional riboflavin kinase/FAD synthetase [Helicobacter cholecystus]|uniref:Riboflavin biosynthesis protein n=1 Tax=Helicobacter cholecystus TaxID=45498 RepID=A0A3D8IY50_9HELI|nr:bifunctional riboflavin kinase/FAD synthetase [Helicobacter cholecystus]RDU69481.1 bifunctional riboflavin kinase/FAD synthetase [Helicobacter cholecystus]VEJ24032.1 bifunctional riboflavin kinase/FMN adenylyltransferase [Helicobacter cholecystus]